MGDMAVVVVCNKTGGNANTAVGTPSMGSDGVIDGTPTMVYWLLALKCMQASVQWMLY